MLSRQTQAVPSQGSTGVLTLFLLVCLPETETQQTELPQQASSLPRGVSQSDWAKPKPGAGNSIPRGWQQPNPLEDITMAS